MPDDVDMIKTENIVHRNDYIQSKNIAETLIKRREANHPYTFIGDLLVALDPEVIFFVYFVLKIYKYLY